MDLAAKRAQGPTGHWLCLGVNALTDDDLFVFVSENDARCQSGLCGQGPDHQFLRESFVGQAGGLMSESADQSGWAQNFVNAVAASLRHQRSQTRRFIEW
jgi:hypothetical protein